MLTPVAQPPPPDRDRGYALKVHVSTSERRAIEARAERAGLSVSAYLRDAGLGRAVRARGASDAMVALSALDGALTELVGAVQGAGKERASAALARVESARDLMIKAAARL